MRPSVFWVCLAVVVPAPAYAQHDNPWHWSAQRLLHEWRAGTNRSGAGQAFVECPATSPRHDSIFSGLIALHHDDDMALALASTWKSGLMRCADPRLHEWYRAQLRGVVNERRAMAIAFLYASVADAEGGRAVRTWMFDPARSPGVREGALIYIAAAFPHTERLHLFRDAYRHMELPDWYLGGELDMLRSIFGDVARIAMLDAVLEQPGAPSAEFVVLLLRNELLFSDAIQSDAWRARFGAGLRQLRAGTTPGVPPRVRSAAERMLAELIAAGRIRER